MRIGKYRIIEEEDYQCLKRDSKNWKERTAIVEDNDIQKEKKRLEKKYKKYFGKKYYHNEEDITFEICGIYYNKYSYAWSWEDKFKFSTSAYNNPHWDWEVSIRSIIDGEYELVSDALEKKGDGGLE